MKPAKQTLVHALRLICSGRGLQGVTRCGLDGCPTGGWPETRQAIRRMEEELPFATQRTYTVYDLIGALYTIDHATGRYKYRG